MKYTFGYLSDDLQMPTKHVSPPKVKLQLCRGKNIFKSEFKLQKFSFLALILNALAVVEGQYNNGDSSLHCRCFHQSSLQG